MSSVNSEIEQLEKKKAGLETAREDLGRKRENMEIRITSLEG